MRIVALLSLKEVSVLFNEPKLLKSYQGHCASHRTSAVSVLFNEPKLLKFADVRTILNNVVSFSALQRAEIAEICRLLR